MSTAMHQLPMTTTQQSPANTPEHLSCQRWQRQNTPSQCLPALDQGRATMPRLPREINSLSIDRIYSISSCSIHSTPSLMSPCSRRLYQPRDQSRSTPVPGSQWRPTGPPREKSNLLHFVLSREQKNKDK